MNKKVKFLLSAMLSCIGLVFVFIAWNCKALDNNTNSAPQGYSTSQSNYYQRVDEYITKLSKIEGFEKFGVSLEEIRTMMKFPMRFAINDVARLVELHRLYDATESMKVKQNEQGAWERNLRLTQLQLEIMKLIKEDKSSW